MWSKSPLAILVDQKTTTAPEPPLSILVDQKTTTAPEPPLSILLRFITSIFINCLFTQNLTWKESNSET